MSEIKFCETCGLEIDIDMENYHQCLKCGQIICADDDCKVKHIADEDGRAMIIKILQLPRKQEVAQ